MGAQSPRVTVVVAEPPQATPLRAERVTAAIADPVRPAPLMADRVSVARRPVITRVMPNSVSKTATNVALTLTGQGLADPTDLRFLRNGIADGAIHFTGLTATGDGTQATVTITSIDSAAPVGDRVLQIVGTGAPPPTATPAGTGTNVLQITP